MAASGSDSHSYQVGQHLVYFGRVYEITKIVQEKDKPEKIVMRPLFQKRAEDTLICKIPVEQIDKTTVRQPLLKKQIKELLKMLNSAKYKEIKIDKDQLTSAMYSDELKSKVVLLKFLWTQKHDPDTKFSFSKKKMLRDLLRNMSEEMALVTNSDLEKSEKQLAKAVGLPA